MKDYKGIFLNSSRNGPVYFFASMQRVEGLGFREGRDNQAAATYDSTYCCPCAVMQT